MPNTRGVFTLSYIREEKIPFDGWVALSDVWVSPSPIDGSNTGYFGGGPGPLSTMDKVTYASDTRTTVPGAALSVARYGLAASSARANALPSTNQV